jgi:hypothetical protein
MVIVIVRGKERYGMLKARARHQLEFYASELPEYAGDTDLAWSESGSSWVDGEAAQRERAVTPKRCSLAAHGAQHLLGAERRQSISESSALMGFLSHDTSAASMCSNVNSIGATWSTNNYHFDKVRQQQGLENTKRIALDADSWRSPQSDG